MDVRHSAVKHTATSELAALRYDGPAHRAFSRHLGETTQFNRFSCHSFFANMRLIGLRFGSRIVRQKQRWSNRGWPARFVQAVDLLDPRAFHWLGREKA